MGGDAVTISPLSVRTIFLPRIFCRFIRRGVLCFRAFGLYRNALL